MRRAASASAGEMAGLTRVRRRAGRGGVALPESAGGVAHAATRIAATDDGGAQGRKSIFHCHVHRAPQPAGPGLSPEIIRGGAIAAAARSR